MKLKYIKPEALVVVVDELMQEQFQSNYEGETEEVESKINDFLWDDESGSTDYDLWGGNQE